MHTSPRTCCLRTDFLPAGDRSWSFFSAAGIKQIGHVGTPRGVGGGRFRAARFGAGDRERARDAPRAAALGRGARGARAGARGDARGDGRGDRAGIGSPRRARGGVRWSVGLMRLPV